jgi:hypothetical protein
MTERFGHSSRCEQAEKPPCACECGGAEHGWQRALDIAEASSGGDDCDRLELAGDADQAWDRARLQGGGRRKPWAETATGQQAAIKSFIAEVIRWLGRERKLRGDIKDLGQPFRISRNAGSGNPRRLPTIEEDSGVVEERVIPGLRKEFGDQRIREFQKKAGNAHFWCELLAQTAHALFKCQGQYDWAKSEVVAMLTSGDEQHPNGWDALLPYQDVIKRAVDLVFRHLPRVATGGISAEGAFRLIWPARVLAVLMCREPRRHWAVRKYCVNPIVDFGTARIKDEVKDRLRRAFRLDYEDAE